MTKRAEKLFYRDFGYRVRAIREKYGISQEELAQAIGLGRTSIVNIEAGRQRMLAHTSYCIAKALGVGIERLM